MTKLPHKEVNRFVAAANGLKEFFARDSHARLHAIAALAAMAMGFILRIEAWEWAAIIFCIVLIICFEMLNTAIEVMCDFLEPGYSKPIKIIKDLAAGAVLASALGSIIVAGLIFLPKITEALFHLE
ncbi:MAG: diacylglycerol kinase family protein [Saprospiraceae bacterium]|nr:diacylglycerol kinase family protein [Saprospiraceae bacterium]